MDVVYSIVEGKFVRKIFFILILGLQFFIPIIAVLTILCVMWYYKDRINEEQPELKKYVNTTLLDDDWKDENTDESQIVKNEKKDS
ncbi:unnamed protein product [Meloidogyne enterolobii]|uniref:Uncharacterized protein n=1 Tax=Meloidogyne enterolobii TaxID=390850 RepID=A0ACB0XMA7_MELEN